MELISAFATLFFELGLLIVALVLILNLITGKRKSKIRKYW